MIQTEAALSAETVGTDVTRFALRHGVLSRYKVLSREVVTEYCDLLTALAAEHAPQGPTEEYLVEELAGIFWRKRRLRLAGESGPLAELAHQGRGRPSPKRSLNLAYQRLAQFWLEQFGRDKLTNHWQPTDCGKLEPASEAAAFLHDAAALICPDRQRLAYELRDLMAMTVRSLKGARRGRKLC